MLNSRELSQALLNLIRQIQGLPTDMSQAPVHALRSFSARLFSSRLPMILAFAAPTTAHQHSFCHSYEVIYSLLLLSGAMFLFPVSAQGPRDAPESYQLQTEAPCMSRLIHRPLKSSPIQTLSPRRLPATQKNRSTCMKDESWISFPV